MTVTPPIDPGKQPSPEWDMVTLKWLGRTLTGTTAAGVLTLKADRTSPLLHDAPDRPVTILPNEIVAPLTIVSLTDGGESREYMYVAVNVPASDDPDITGSGFTYTASIKLANNATYGPYTFTVPWQTPGGVMWLNQVVAATPAQGQTLPQITISEFNTAVARIDALELGGGSGGGPHASTHATGGADPVSLTAAQITSGVFQPARMGTGTPNSTRVLYGDGTWKVAPTGGAGAGGTDSTITQGATGLWPVTTRVGGIHYRWLPVVEPVNPPTLADGALPGDELVGLGILPQSLA